MLDGKRVRALLGWFARKVGVYIYVAIDQEAGDFLNNEMAGSDVILCQTITGKKYDEFRRTLMVLPSHALSNLNVNLYRCFVW